MYPNRYYCIMVFRVCQGGSPFFCNFVSIILNKLKKKVGQKTKKQSGGSKLRKVRGEAAGAQLQKKIKKALQPG